MRKIPGHHVLSLYFPPCYHWAFCAQCNCMFISNSCSFSACCVCLLATVGSIVMPDFCILYFFLLHVYHHTMYFLVATRISDSLFFVCVCGHVVTNFCDGQVCPVFSGCVFSKFPVCSSAHYCLRPCSKACSTVQINKCMRHRAERYKQQAAFWALPNWVVFPFSIPQSSLGCICQLMAPSIAASVRRCSLQQVSHRFFLACMVRSHVVGQ